MRRSPNISALTFALILLLVLPGMALAGKGKKQAAQSPAGDEQAARILEKSCKALTGFTGYSFKAAVTLDKVYQDGSKIQAGRTMSVSVKRPGAFSIVTEGDDFWATSAFDGKVFTLALPDRKVYGQIEAAMDTDALMDMLATRYGIESPLGDLLSNSPCTRLDSKSGFYVGKAKVDGVVCDHLFFLGKDVDWQLWIEDSPASLPRKMVITEKKQPSAPQFTAVLSDWKTDGAALQVSGFTAPADFTRDDSVITGRKLGKK
ncbi:DUF2092 domain-containing protein [Fundidesulfovibrio terrae]|uniref:DUF2092 domain-containing protein n=1 Tax=Fundidesulfovibrio terrae TaxID=2922866 RepID=UPI001FAEB152|nr:DUF2092 domain-containing protein [Fundidesulfovibrio terrae]